MSALVIKSTTAHLFHVGDARIYRLNGGTLEQLTEDHRLWVSHEQSYLSRALGIESQLDIDYQPLPVEAGDFLLATDGVHDSSAARVIVDHQGTRGRLRPAARIIVREAHEHGSADNLTLQVVRIERCRTTKSARSSSS